MHLDQLKQALKSEAKRLGFVRCGIAPAEPLAHDDFFQRWLDRGMNGTMDYLTKTRHQRADPKQLLPSARSAVVVAARYQSEETTTTHDEKQADLDAQSS